MHLQIPNVFVQLYVAGVETNSEQMQKEQTTCLFVIITAT